MAYFSLDSRHQLLQASLSWKTKDFLMITSKCVFLQMGVITVLSLKIWLTSSWMEMSFSQNIILTYMEKHLILSRYFCFWFISNVMATLSHKAVLNKFHIFCQFVPTFFRHFDKKFYFFRIKDLCRWCLMSSIPMTLFKSFFQDVSITLSAFWIEHMQKKTDSINRLNIIERDCIRTVIIVGFCYLKNKTGRVLLEK